MKIKTPKDVGHYIASTRKALKWSQTDLATKIGKDQRFVSKLENDPTSVSFGTVLMVLNVLNIKTDLTSHATTNLNSQKTEESKASAGGQRIPKWSNNVNNIPLSRSDTDKFLSNPIKTPAIVSKKKTEK